MNSPQSPLINCSVPSSTNTESLGEPEELVLLADLTPTYSVTLNNLPLFSRSPPLCKVKDWLIPALTRCNNNEHHRGSGIFPRKGGFCLDTHSMREHNL